MNARILCGVLLGTTLALWCGAASAEDGDPGAVLTRLLVVGDDGALPARGGIPLPRELGVLDPAELGIARETRDDAGVLQRMPLPVQWRVLSRWDGAAGDRERPIRWVLADVDAAPQDALVLTRGGAAPPVPPPVAFEAEGGVVLDTGRLAFRVPRERFAPLAHARLRRTDFDASAVTALADDGISAELVTRDAAGTLRAFRPSVPDTAIEDSGPLRTTVLVSGAFVDSDGAALRHGDVSCELRVTTWRGAAAVTLEWTLINRSDHALDVAAWSVRLPTRWTGEVECQTIDGDVTGGRIALTQTMRPGSNGEAAFAYALAVDGAAAAVGARSPGALRLYAGGRGLGVAVERFYETGPKSIAYEDGELDLEILPFADAPRGLAPGRSVSSVVHLDFSADARGGFPSERTRRLVPDAAWIAVSGALAPLAPLGCDVGDDVRNVAARHLERLQLGLIDAAACDPQGPAALVPPASIVTQRDLRGGANPAYPYSLDLYGWDRFGDLVDASGLAHGAHAWVEGLCRAYAARHDPRFLDAAYELAEPRLASALANDPNGAALPGLLLLHALTGDERVLSASRAIAVQLSAGARRARSGARRMAAFVAFYEHTGDRRALRDAVHEFERVLVDGEHRERRAPTQRDVLALDGLVRVHRATGDARALSELLRRLRWIWDVGYAGTGRVVDDVYLPLQLHDTGGGVPLGLPAGLAVADAFAYVHMATGVEAFQERARAVFRDAVLFIQAPAMQFVAPGPHAAVSAAPLRHAGREIAYGELVLNGAPWLLSADAGLVATGALLPQTDEPVLVRTAAAMGRSQRDGAVSPEGPSENEEGSAAGVPEDESTGAAPTANGLVVDDTKATLSGAWRSVAAAGAIGGSQSVATPRDEVATAEFRMTPEWNGRGRVYLRRLPVPRAAARVVATVRTAGGAARTSLRPPEDDGRWQLLGEFGVNAASPLVVRFECAAGRGAFAVDALKLVRVR